MARNGTKKDDSPKGVGVDPDAVAKHDPVTVVVSPAGNDYDADTWSDANNFLGAGYSIKDGYPTGPTPVDPSAADGDAKADPGHAAATPPTAGS